ncbi:HEPN domain-containing protein [Planctomycetales bacterium ZRK34]|nr:HEPN domain-containing protein [Planctomycetales bacterium ZRK34]
MKPADQVRREIAESWLNIANADLQSAEVLLAHDPPLLYPSCFHSQQAAEKCLKAYLTWHQIEFPKTHSIAELLALIESVDNDLSSQLSAACALTPYGVEIRYPKEEPEPDQDEAVTALLLARQVRAAICKLLPNF